MTDSYHEQAAPFPSGDGPAAGAADNLRRYHAAAGCTSASIGTDLCADDSPLGRARFMSNCLSTIFHHDAYLLLTALQELDPAKADEVARHLVLAAEAGDSYGEWLWEWTADLGIDADRICTETRERFALESADAKSTAAAE